MPRKKSRGSDIPETFPYKIILRVSWKSTHDDVSFVPHDSQTSTQPHLNLGDNFARMLHNLGRGWILMLMIVRGAAIAKLFKKVEYLNSGRVAEVMILIGTNNASRKADEEKNTLLVCSLSYIRL